MHTQDERVKEKNSHLGHMMRARHFETRPASLAVDILVAHKVPPEAMLGWFNTGRSHTTKEPP